MPYKYEIHRTFNITPNQFMGKMGDKLCLVSFKDGNFRVIIGGNPNKILTHSQVPNYLRQFARGVWAGQSTANYKVINTK